MNKIIHSKTENKKIIVLYNHKKDLIGYVLEKHTPVFKRILYSHFTINKKEAKTFLTL